MHRQPLMKIYHPVHRRLFYLPPAFSFFFFFTSSVFVSRTVWFINYYFTYAYTNLRFHRYFYKSSYFFHVSTRLLHASLSDFYSINLIFVSFTRVRKIICKTLVHQVHRTIDLQWENPTHEFSENLRYEKCA